MSGLYGLIGDSKMKAFTAIMLILLTACSMWLVVEAFELRKRNLTLAIQMSGLEDRMNYQMQLIDKLLERQKQAEITGDLLHRGGGTIEYTHPIYRIPEGNK